MQPEITQRRGPRLAANAVELLAVDVKRVASSALPAEHGMKEVIDPGWERGIRIGDIKSGWIKAFIHDEEATRGAGTEFLGVDGKGRIVSGASGRPGLVVHELFRPLF